MGETQRRAVVLVAQDVAAGQAEGTIRNGDPRVMAQALLLVAQSFLLSGGIAEDVPREALAEEVERLVDAALNPALERVP
jgi:hypothetical protein